MLPECVAVSHFVERPEGIHRQKPGNSYRINGLMLMLVSKGTMVLRSNAELVEVEAGSLVAAVPGSTWYFYDNLVSGGEVYVLMISERFLKEININFSALFMPMIGESSLVWHFRPDQARLLEQYYLLLLGVCGRRVVPRIDRSIASSIISGLIYQIVQMYIENMAPGADAVDATGRPSNYVQEFMRLLQMHYMQERSVSFYASKLFISSKYLSQLVKRATGRTASRWIDDRVITEARNLLRYSDKNIQQIAYMLNFSNQSAFGKYFKHLTGMSPSDYQRQ